MIRVILVILIALPSACVSSSPGDSQGIIGDHCVVSVEVSGRELTAVATYSCQSRTEVTAYLDAYARVADDLFQFGTHVQIVTCGSSLSERYLIPLGVSPEIVLVEAGFDQGGVRCGAGYQ